MAIGNKSLNGYERNMLFRNFGTGRFEEVAYATAGNRIEDGRGLAVADLDRDGRLDLVLNNYDRPATLLMGRGDTGHWLAIELRAATTEIGAKVRVMTRRGRHQRAVHAGSGYLSCSSPILHFGLGDATRIERIEIDWPSGTRQVLDGLDTVDRRITVEEPARADNPRLGLNGAASRDPAGR